MKINESLNLVVPVRSDEKGAILYAYHTPISREVFETNYRILAATKAALSSKGVHYAMDAGPTIAALALRDEGRKDALERGDVDAKGNPGDGGGDALMNEIKRLTTILAPSASGWDHIPVDVAVGRDVIDADEWKEVEAKLAFFTCHYALAHKKNREAVVQATSSILEGWSTSLSITEWIVSLPTSTNKETTETKAVSSVPS